MDFGDASLQNCIFPNLLFAFLGAGLNPNLLPQELPTWIQGKLGKQYLRNKVTLHWESNPGPTPILLLLLAQVLAHPL